jgi:hypothetical protein
MQLFVSVGGILIMIGLAWLLDRARKVPVLFVDAAEFKEVKPALQPGSA